MKKAEFSRKIKDGDKVLDIGSGHRPYPEATHLLDFTELGDEERGGEKLIRDDRPFINWDLEKTPWPLKDNEFDYVHASDILEHLENPLKMCREMERIAKAGWIGGNTPFYEEVYGVDVHWWINEVRDGRLYFIRKRRGSYMTNITKYLYHRKEDEVFQQWYDNHIDEWKFGFYWEDHIKISIIR